MRRMVRNGLLMTMVAAAMFSAACGGRSESLKEVQRVRSGDLNIVLLVDVGDVKRPVLSYPAGCWLINTYLDAPGRNGTELSPRNQTVSLAES